jgi:hypothetical protein
MCTRLGASGIARHGRRLWPLGALALVVLAVHPGSAQEQPRFTSGTELVVLDVLVTDGHGKAVAGLTADDFHVVEKGRPQKIQAFSFLTVPPVPRAEAERAAAAPVRDVITNHVASHSRAFVVVIDDLHLLPQFQEHTRRVLTDVLMSIPTTDRVAVVFTGRSDLSIDFTDDRAAQVRAVGRVQNALAFAMDPTPVACGAKEVERRHQATGTLDVLRNVVTTLTQTRADERSARGTVDRRYQRLSCTKTGARKQGHARERFPPERRRGNRRPGGGDEVGPERRRPRDPRRHGQLLPPRILA